MFHKQKCYRRQGSNRFVASWFSVKYKIILQNWNFTLMNNYWKNSWPRDVDRVSRYLGNWFKFHASWLSEIDEIANYLLSSSFLPTVSCIKCKCISLSAVLVYCKCSSTNLKCTKLTVKTLVNNENFVEYKK